MTLFLTTNDQYESWGGWWPGCETGTAVPYGVCGLHGAWDTSRYTACPSCSSAAPVKQYTISPQLDPPEQTCPLHGWFKAWMCPSCAASAPAPPMRFEEKRPWKCPVCDGRGTVPCGFYTGLPGSTKDGLVSTAPEKCRSCEDGIIWR